MKNNKLKRWRLISNISAYTGGALAIIDTFFGNYINGTFIIIIMVLTIALFLISKLMEFILKKQNKNVEKI